MRDFLKQNLLAILVCLFAMAAFASATSLTRPYTSADYAGGQKAVGSKVNSEFDNIVNWINGANIASGNIASLGVATSNLADLGVTTGKLADGAATKAKQTSNYAITAGSGAFSISSTSTVLRTITNASTTITTVGKPVLVSLMPAGDVASCSIAADTWGELITGGGGVGAPNMMFIRDSSTVARFAFTDSQVYQCSSFNFVDQPAAGVHTYAAKVSLIYTSGTYAITVCNCKLAVQEL